MITYISLLRGINVGGHKIAMPQLKELYQSLNFKHVKTYIQSGNVLFETSGVPVEKLKEEIEVEIEKTFNLQVPVFILTIEELKMIIENNPFPDENPRKIHVTFLSEPPVERPVEEINGIKDGSEKFLIAKKEIYLFLPQGYGRTKLSNTFFERKLNLSATTRNWRTVNKLYELAK